ncbi:MAG TPA: hypothetical protein VMW56_29360, partial [Candidatus Margulisiibacteriota bacterium]|nr:hypothetical protein [Candidatus Margulisiibacteriota bacterium]
MTDPKLSRRWRTLPCWVAAGVGVLVLLGHSAPVFARAGDVDTSFGSNGGLFDPVGPRAAAHAVVIQGDGRIVVAGEAS